MSMTDKQKFFADEYLSDLNGTRAYKVAYTAVKKDATAAANASRLLRNAKVRAYIEEQLLVIKTQRTATAQEVIEFLSHVLRDDEVIVRDRLKSADLLGRYYALFTDKQVATIEGAISVSDPFAGLTTEELRVLARSGQND